ncbi:hypothetical protein CC85DRAFT_286447 [Cutaneotrichosporon oleaginosum]|uniref:Uncharacterized protein n=1 Tax=Cutaneotrichosporon oleaginosum TaxID=879819 RepID=A0A0J1B1F0_9TREE|nr:uncharacterized protein CC85DRAFT_286447 [Cutaneotrichosporon oleaginosum]KLT41419.1 hypothetical protein CC85DRAFT_286447 [Cutaneotrichosporon oleaginosum]TXT12182.1 hypothetical protein COLE_02592 [Cutaneotrichosporon oleaginosum]
MARTDRASFDRSKIDGQSLRGPDLLQRARSCVNGARLEVNGVPVRIKVSVLCGLRIEAGTHNA